MKYQAAPFVGFMFQYGYSSAGEVTLMEVCEMGWSETTQNPTKHV